MAKETLNQREAKQDFNKALTLPYFNYIVCAMVEFIQQNKEGEKTLVIKGVNNPTLNAAKDSHKPVNAECREQKGENIHVPIRKGHN